ncbi:MAG: DUF2520 domain-containing protein [Blastocatellia bacterium]|nr:DUF2520 domain-containing protein [Blastocatellia bacterium]
MDRIAIIGPGRVGNSLARALHKTDLRISGLFGRNAGSAHASLEQTASIGADIVVVSVPDPAIRSVVELLRTRLDSDTVVLHTSGLLTSEILDPLRTDERSVGSMHPLVSFNARRGPKNPYRGAYFGLEGDADAVTAAMRIVTALGAEFLIVPAASKALYHAAAVTACGHITALFDLSVAMMRKAGVDSDAAEKALMHLAFSTLRNIENDGRANSLTGTFARADTSGFASHLDAFEDNLYADELEIYLALGVRSLKLALENGIAAEDVEEIAKMIAVAKEKSRC